MLNSEAIGALDHGAGIAKLLIFQNAEYLKGSTALNQYGEGNPFHRFFHFQRLTLAVTLAVTLAATLAPLCPHSALTLPLPHHEFVMSKSCIWKMYSSSLKIDYHFDKSLLIEAIS